MTTNNQAVAVQNCGSEICVRAEANLKAKAAASDKKPLSGLATPSQIGFCSYCWGDMPVIGDRERAIAQIIVGQIQPLTLMGCGFVGYVPRMSGTLLRFRLAGRAYGVREVEIVLNGADYYDVTVYRYGKGMKKILVTESKDVDCERLDGVVYDGIAKSA